MDEILFLLSEYGLTNVLLALVVNLLTSIVKTPIKRVAKKLNDSSKLTRFIVFLPVILGFGVVFAYLKFINLNFVFDKKFITLWTTTSSLSLTFYAVVEKLFLGKKTIKDEELKESKDSISKVEEVAISIVESIEKEDKTEKNVKETQSKKIVLKGSNNAKITIKKE